MIKKIVSLILLTAFLPILASVALTVPSTCTFTTSTILKRGSTHPDILIMQRILNLDPATQIAKTGSGSPGKENSYFGTLSYNALLKFQSKYAVTVEKGILGTVTRAKLTQVCTATPVVIKPSNSTLPTISSVTNATTLTLTASNGTWNNTPTSYTYRWLRNGTGITNATYSTYTTKSSDAGSTISVRVTATNKAGSASATSLPKTIANPVVAITPVNTALPVISVVNGSTLSTSNGSWNNTPTSYSYQWKRNSVAISGATTATYATSTADAGTTLTVTVTAQNTAGSAAATSLGKVIAAPIVTPTPTPTPTPTTNTLSLTTTSGLGYITGTGITTCTSSCTSSIASGTLVTLTAVAVTGNTFSGWSGACSGTATTCTVSMTSAKSVSATFTATPVISTTAISIPANIEAEDFNQGGEGVGYHDNVSGNSGGLYRTNENVDIITSLDTLGGGYVVNNFETGEWLAYTINSSSSALYNIELRASSMYGDSSFRIEIDGVNVSGTVVVPNTGRWGTFQWVGKNNVAISSGRHTVKIVAVNQYFNVNSLRFTASTVLPTDSTAPTTPTGLSATAISSSQINLSWTASTDAVGVVGYKVYRGGIQIATTTSATYSNTGLTASTAYIYSVAAYDAASNTSSQSTGASATTQSATVVSTTGLPELPRVYIDTTYVAPTGTVLRPTTASEFQAALDTVQPGQVIELTAGATYTGNFRIRPKTSGSAMIHIRSSRYAELPPNTRVTPAQAKAGDNLMAKIVSPNSDPALDFVFDGTNGASNYRVIGLEVTNSSTYAYRLINTGYNYQTGAQPTLASQLSNNIILDRMYIHGGGNCAIRSGVVMNTGSMALIDSYISEIYQPGSDSQATMAWNGTGPLKIVNNYLEAASENIMFGGSDASLGKVPGTPKEIISDIEIKGNHVYKPLAWIKSGLNVKNLIEFKQGQRALIEGNIFENNFADAQSGFALLITPRNQDGGQDWAKVQDITVRNNKFINVGAGMNFAGRDGNHKEMYDNETYGTTLVSKRILVENNVVTITGINYSDNRAYQVLSGPENLTIRHNTTFWVPGLNNIGYGAAVMAESTPKAKNFTFENNIQDWNYYGFIGGGTGNINSTLATWFESNAVVNKNAFIGGSAGTTTPPATNNFFPANYGAVGFTNQAGGDYSLTSASQFKNAGSDGTDLGVNMSALSAALATTAIDPSDRVTPATFGLLMDTANGSISASGMTTCTGNCMPKISSDTTITLTATPNLGYYFNGWGYACSGNTGKTCSFIMNSLKYVTANFIPILSLTAPSNSVTASYAWATDSSSPATVVTLTVAPAYVATFTGWSGACSGMATTCTFTTSVPTTVTASFR